MIVGKKLLSYTQLLSQRNYNFLIKLSRIKLGIFFPDEIIEKIIKTVGVFDNLFLFTFNGM